MSDRPLSRYAAIAAALVLATLGFLPIADLLAGGESLESYRLSVEYWSLGALIAAGIGLVVAILARGRALPAVERLGARLASWIAAHWRAFTLLAALGALVLYVAISLAVFDGRPLQIDEISQALQARVYARGALSTPIPEPAEFFQILHTVHHDGRQFSHFPAGGSAMLALGQLIGAQWIVNPVFGALAVLAFAYLARAAEPRAGIAAAAVVLLGLSPFVAYMSGSYMNHVPALALSLVGAAALVYGLRGDRSRPLLAFAAGLGFGLSATVRPLDAMTFALPAAAWYLARALREPRRWADAFAAAAGVAIPVSALLWVNARTTGAPLLFGYEQLWGPSVRLGFHIAPFGLPHTPRRGLELLNEYVFALQSFLFEAPIPSLLLAIVALALARKLEAVDRYLLACGTLLLGAYFAYWHRGIYLGPRFLFGLVPMLVLWTARAPAAIAARVPSALIRRAMAVALVVAIVMAATDGIPTRGRRYAAAFPVERWDAVVAAERAGARGAVVLVRESWSSQLVVRLWALGLARTDAEGVYRNSDACRLDHAIDDVERRGLRGGDALAALRPVLADSALVQTYRAPSGTTARVVPGRAYDARCLLRLHEDGAGTLPLAPFTLVEDGTTYARDLHARDTLLLQRWPGRPVFLLVPSEPVDRSLPRFVPLSRDSAARAWALDR